MSLQQAIDVYHSLLTPELAEDSGAQLVDQLARRGLFFGSRPLCSVLRPRFLTPEQYALLRKRIAVLLSAFDKLYRAAMAEPAIRAQFRLTDWEEELIRADPGFSEPSPVSRLDAFFVHERGGLKFTEYNAETPAAASYNDVLAAVFLGLPAMREFLRTHEVTAPHSRHNVLHALVAAYLEWSGRREKPRIAIIDWKDVPTYSEFVITQEYFRELGYECTITDPQSCEYRGGRLYADGFETDLVYKRVLINELIEWGGLDQPLVRAVRDGAVCMVNPFRCKLLHKKASLAALSDEANARLLTAEERDAVAAHIPWTRVVEERRTTADGGDVELVPYIVANQARLVLKPNDEYGGKGIVLGWEVSPAEWEEVVRAALAEPYVVQERVELPREPFPSLVDGRLEMIDRIVDTAPFCFHGSYMDGCLSRLSTASLVNVTAGSGSSVATFIVQRR